MFCARTAGACTAAEHAGGRARFAVFCARQHIFRVRPRAGGEGAAQVCRGVMVVFLRRCVVCCVCVVFVAFVLLFGLFGQTPTRRCENARLSTRQRGLVLFIVCQLHCLGPN